MEGSGVRAKVGCGRERERDRKTERGGAEARAEVELEAGAVRAEGAEIVHLCTHDGDMLEGGRAKACGM